MRPSDGYQIAAYVHSRQMTALEDRVQAHPNLTWPRLASLSIDNAHTPLTDRALQRFVDSFEPDLPNPPQSDASISSFHSQGKSSQYKIASSMTSLESDGDIDLSAINQFTQDNLNQQLIISLKEQMRIHDLNFPNTSNLSRSVRNVEQTGCRHSCKCRCHNRVSSPRILRHVIGWLYVDISAACHLETCLSDGLSQYRMKYLFPTWFLYKRLDVMLFSHKGFFTLRFYLHKRFPIGDDLFKYAQVGDTDGIRNLFKQRPVSPMDQTESGATALHLAFASRQITVCKFLLAAGADPLMEDDFNRTPLEYAAYSSLVELSIPVANILKNVKGIIRGDSNSTTECLIIKKSMMELKAFAHEVEDKDRVANLSNMVGKAFLEAACKIELEHVRQETTKSTSGYAENRSCFGRLSSNLTKCMYTTILDGGSKWWSSSILSTLSKCGFPLFEALFELYGTLEIFDSLRDHALQCERPLREGFRRLRWDCVCDSKYRPYHRLYTHISILTRTVA